MMTLMRALRYSALRLRFDAPEHTPWADDMLWHLCLHYAYLLAFCDDAAAYFGEFRPHTMLITPLCQILADSSGHLMPFPRYRKGHSAASILSFSFRTSLILVVYSSF